MDTPPPPPPPSPTPAPAATTAAPAAKSRKMIYAIILIVIIVVVGVVAAVMLMKPGGSLSAEQIANAHSIQFTASFTTGGTTSDFTYYAKNIGTDNMMMKMEGTVAGTQMTMIVNGAQHKAWVNVLGQWMDMSSQFDTYWSSLSQSWSSTSSGLGNWNGQSDYTYTDPSGQYSVHVTNIRVNPDLADSMFVHS
jgi:hypothetical protein